MSEVATIENLRMEEAYRDQESNQARLAGRGKSACCRQCGSADGMRSVHRDSLGTARDAVWYGRWYEEQGNSEYLFYACETCNWTRLIPTNFEELSRDGVQDWLDRDTDPKAPDWAALAAEPGAATAGQDSRESAGLEG